MLNIRTKNKPEFNIHFKAIVSTEGDAEFEIRHYSNDGLKCVRQKSNINNSKEVKFDDVWDMSELVITIYPRYDLEDISSECARFRPTDFPDTSIVL